MGFPNAFTDHVVVIGDSDGSLQTIDTDGADLESAVFENDNAQGGMFYAVIQNGATGPDPAAQILIRRRAKGRDTWCDLYTFPGTTANNDMTVIGDVWLTGRYEYQVVITRPTGQAVEIECIFMPGAA